MDANALKIALLEQTRALGFDACRVARAGLASHRDAYREWIANGYHGGMAWMERNAQRREDPRQVQPGAQSVIVLATNYYPAAHEFHADYRIARYAWNQDYHDLLEGRLKSLELWLTQQGGQQRRYVDTGPVLERSWASEAGLGWGGKSTMQIHPKLGTWFFLSEILTTLELTPDEPARDHCGKCRRCIDACPTGAIIKERQLDARRCLSYLSIEHRGSIPLEFRKAMGNRIYGCDDCLSACPWNRFAQITREAAFHERSAVAGMRLRDFLTLDDAGFRSLFAGSPIKRIKRPAFLRNVCVALGNCGTPEDLAALRLAAADPEPLIAEHAQWAIEQLQHAAALLRTEA